MSPSGGRKRSLRLGAWSAFGSVTGTEFAPGPQGLTRLAELCSGRGGQPRWSGRPSSNRGDDDETSHSSVWLSGGLGREPRPGTSGSIRTVEGPTSPRGGRVPTGQA